MAQFVEHDGSLLVSVRCLGLGISSKSPLPKAGLFSNLYVSLTKSPTVKNEKKYVRIEQSDHFLSHVKIQHQTQPSSSSTLQFRTIYTSEIFEDIIDVFPSLLVRVRTQSSNYDSKLKLSVHYSSSLTSSKDIVLAYQSFYESDLIRTVQQSSVYVVPLESEYCIASKAYLDIIQPLPALLENTILPITSISNDKNPLMQNYVFYNEMDSITPYLDAKEQCWEPKFAASIPMAFFTNLQGSLERSIRAWEDRAELERMRQGRFSSDAEALSSGWNIIDILVKGARIGSTKATIDRLNLMKSQSTANGNTASSTSTPTKESRNESKDSIANTNPSKDSMIYINQYPLSEEYSEIPIASSTLDKSVASATASPSVSAGKHESVTRGRRTASSNNNLGFKFLGGSSGGKRGTDESLPSTFVDIYIEDLSKPFIDLVGRTNTEYHTMYPVYGSNLNSSMIRKPNLHASTASDVVKIVTNEQEFPFQVVESSNRQYIPQRWRFANTFYSEANDFPYSLTSNSPLAAEQPVTSFTTVSGKQSRFRKYISNSDHTFVRLDFCFETSGGKKKCVGTVAVPVNVKERRVSGWFPIRSFTHTLEEAYAVFDNIEIFVDIEVTTAETAVDLLDTVNDQMVDVYTYHRQIDGRVDIDQLNERKKKKPWPLPRFQQHRTVIADCYEWLWQLGFTGHDPFILEPGLTLVGGVRGSESSQENSEGHLSSNPYPESAPELARLVLEGEAMGDSRGLSPKDTFRTDRTSLLSQSDDEDHLRSTDVIEISKALSSITLLPSSKEGGEAKKRKSRVKYVNRATLPDSDDEFPANLVAATTGSEKAEEDSDLETTLLRPRKSIFDTGDDLADLINSDRSLGKEIQPSNQTLEPNHRPLSLPHESPSHDRRNRSQSDDLAVAQTNSLPQTRRALAPFKPFSRRDRIDCALPLDWIQQHIKDLKKLLEDIKGLYLPDLRRRVRSERSFRSSVLKKEPLVQPLPTNLHYQLLGVRKHCVACVEAQPKIPEIIHSITCGALTPHQIGHKAGGLFHQEGLLIADKDKILSLKQQYLKKLHHFGGAGIRTEGEHSPYHLLQEIGRAVGVYDSTCVSVGRRRMLAISQGLSVAISALMLKLNLLVAGHIPHQIANRWLSAGFLIVFEGLLSVVGNERSMLEDTISAVEALKSYQVRILPNTFNSSSPDIVPNDQERPPSASRGREDRLSRDSSDLPESQRGSTRQGYNSSDGGDRFRDFLNSSSAPCEDQTVSVDFEMKGREIQLFLSEAAIGRLPEEYQQLLRRFELVLSFYPVLFTQGIDIQQTMVTTFGGDSASKKRTMTSLDLQNHVNRIAFDRLNAYCFQTQPIGGKLDLITDIDNKREISRPSEPNPRSSSLATRPKESIPMEIHPLSQNLHDSIRNSSLTMKNVDLLIEVERLSLILGGIRVTFCKSGKDRTGMAVTLEQARQLGERFACGITTSRLVKDANLMRVHGCRLMVAEKNIGKPVYSINVLQAQFLPELFRPPASVCEDILKKDNS